VRGHALYLQAMHGGKATHDPLDSPKIAVWLRGGLLPQADVYPAARRAPRDVLRRRMPLRRQRAALLRHVQHTHRQYTRPALGTKMASPAHRAGGAAPFPDPAGQHRLDVDRALIAHDDPLLMDLARHIGRTATQPDAPPLYRLPTVPGRGKRFSWGRPYAIHAIDRVPRGQDFASYGRLVQCAKASASTRYGTSGKQIGPADRTWACSEAAVRLLRHHPTGQTCRARLAPKHGQGKAFTVLAHKLARAVYAMLPRDTGFDRDPFLHRDRRRAGEPDASRDSPGSSLNTWPWHPGTLLRHRTRRRTVARLPAPGRLIGHPLWLWARRRESSTVSGGCPSPAPGAHWRTMDVQPPFCSGREAGTALLLGRRGPYGDCSALAFAGDSASIRVWCRPLVCTGAQKARQDRRPTVDCARPGTAEKKAKNRSEGEFVS
jgi:hypothetical protein